ncbi:Vesicular glutamate transporter 1 like protein [Argiope bruennichi]|uniref:Vesicular glutamate transporter 1 like protein n=1 Tax=Argiope bruennichi TaxID=94029 RepID=A0A8T0FEA0_ARGBR|nr:Vesicular glutamate transporter 1 like protein [Argiope bruennichi]
MIFDRIKNAPGRMVEGIMNKIKRKRRKYSFNAKNVSENTDSVASERKTARGPNCLGKRHIVAMLGFFNCFFINANRSVVSVSIVAMVKHIQPNETFHLNNREVSCPFPSASENTIEGPTGFVIPAMFRMASNWFPSKERGFLSTLVVCGYGFGVAATGILTGWLCDTPHLRWPSAFYFWGSTTLILAAAFAFLLHEHPQDHPTITEEELKYITDGQEMDLSEKTPSTPWKKMLTSPASYAYFFGLFGHYWSIAYFLIVHPTFMGAFGFAICMIGMGLAGCNATISILLFSLSLFTSGMALSGVMISGMDMAPVHAGALMGIACTIAGLSSLIIPLLTGFLTTHEALSEWKKVFWISSAIVGLSGVVYAAFGSAEVQAWNFPGGKFPEKLEEDKGKGKAENKSTEP